MHDAAESSSPRRSPSLAHHLRWPAARLLGALAVLVSAGALAGMGCGQSPPPSAVDPPPLGAQGPGDGACRCTDGFYYNNVAIPPEDTRCDTFVCGRDRIAYNCLDDDRGDKWNPYPGNVCGDLSCPGQGTFCGADVVNGEPAALYECPGEGQIPLEWRICKGACRNRACADAPTSECPCEVPPVAGGEHIPRTCGQRVCFPTGAGSGGVQRVCTAEGWQSLGMSCAQRAGTCNACRGVQDSFGHEVTTTACGETMCGLGIGNSSLWVCGEEGWLDLNRPCSPSEPGEENAEFGRCPEQFLDNDGQWKSVERGQTFCGDQVFRSPWNNDLARSLGEAVIRIKGKADQLFACPGPGARPVPYANCGRLGGSGECKRARELPPMHRHEVIGVQPAPGDPKIRDWDRCDQACPTSADAYYSFVQDGNNGYNDCRHMFCGQHEITGRVGTRYYCSYDTWSYCPPPKDAPSAVVGRPVPYEECSEACERRDPKIHHDVCSLHAHEEPFGIPDPTPDPSPSARCDVMLDYQGNEVPSASRRRGASVCGLGGQVFECRDRGLHRPDGWHATGVPCGTACGICGPDPYGTQSSFCASIMDFFNNTCSAITADPNEIACNQSALVRFNEPAYCGHNPDLGSQGDPWMLYVCKAYCPRESGAQTIWAPCEGNEGQGSRTQTRTRIYKFDRAVYCPMGCQVNEQINDVCRSASGGFQPPFPEARILQNLGRKPDWADGRHLGEDLVKTSGPTAGTYVFPIGPGKVLRAGVNCSQYLGMALVEHRFKENGQDRRFCSFYGHLDVSELAVDLVGQQIDTQTPLGKIVYWDDIPRLHNAHCGNQWEECPSKKSFPCNPDNSHLHYVVLSDAECDRFDDPSVSPRVGAPPGYDGCDTPTDVSHSGEEGRLEAYTALDSSCDSPISATEGYISPGWFVSSPVH